MSHSSPERPRPFFLSEEPRTSLEDGSSHNQTLSRQSSSQFEESGPEQPSSSGQGAAVSNPFSPPGSIISFNGDLASPTSPASTHTHYPFLDSDPRGTISSTRSSAQDLQRFGSYYGPRTDAPSRTPSGTRIRESFASPPTRPMTIYSGINVSAPSKSNKRMRSTMLTDPSTIEKPWTQKKDPYARIAYLVTYSVAFLGIVASAIRCYFGWISVPMITQPLCLVLDEEFNGTTDSTFGTGGNWFREVEAGGYGNGEFEMTTSSDNNSYISNGYLYITPTLTSDLIGQSNVLDGYIYNLTDCTYNETNPASLPNSQGSNTSTFDAAAYYQACSAVSNSTLGTVINPVQSARISTRNSASMMYGRVEVRAKLPAGDWFWPAIWMLPVNNTYGPWPMSGEIDIMESRGNPSSYPDQGINYVRGSLNWGPATFLDAVYKTYGWWTQRRSDYGQAFHIYSLEWTETFLRVYVDTRLHFMLDLSFNEPFFSRGDFPTVVYNGTEEVVLENPWINGTNATPFDQQFYLILDLAVGGTNGWFPDNAGGKPWLDAAPNAMQQFAEAQSSWYSTWASDVEDRSLVVDYVKMWQIC